MLKVEAGNSKIGLNKYPKKEITARTNTFDQANWSTDIHAPLMRHRFQEHWKNGGNQFAGDNMESDLEETSVPDRAIIRELGITNFVSGRTCRPVGLMEKDA